MAPEGSAFAKTIETGSKNGPEYAIARVFLAAHDTRPLSIAETASGPGKAYRVGSVPLHFD